jgi:hypothetical protein
MELFRRSSFLIPTRFRDDQKQVSGLLTDMAFPDVQQVHIIHNCLPAFYLEKYSDFALEIVWSQAPTVILRKKPGLLWFEAKLSGARQNHILYFRTIRTANVFATNLVFYFWPVQEISQSYGNRLSRLKGCIEFDTSFHQLDVFDGHRSGGF